MVASIPSLHFSELKIDGDEADGTSIDPVWVIPPSIAALSGITELGANRMDVT